MKSRQRPALLLLLVLLLGLLAACQNDEEVAAPAAESEVASPVDETNQLAVSTGQGLVSAEGVVVPQRSVDLSFQTGGTVAEILLEPGADVAAGEALIRLEASALENAVRQAEAGVTAAQANQAAAEAQLALAQSGIQRAEAGVTAAEARLALVQAGPLPEEIAAAEQNIAAAEGGITQAAGNRDAAVSPSQARIRAAEAEVAAARAEAEALEDAYQRILDACFETPTGDEVCPLYGPVEENTRFQLEAARANVAAAEQALDEAQAGATAAERQAAGAGVAVAQAQRDQAQAQLNLLLAGARDEQIQQAEVGVAQAALAIDQAQVEVSQAEAAVQQAAAGLTTAQANLEAAQKALDRTVLRAPFDGRLGDVAVEVGEFVAPGVPVAQFGGFGEWVVKTTDLTELDVVQVSVGQEAEVTVDAIPGEVIGGEVIDIAAVSQLVRGDVTFEVVIALEPREDLPLRWGMTAFVDILTE